MTSSTLARARRFAGVGGGLARHHRARAAQDAGALRVDPACPRPAVLRRPARRRHRVLRRTALHRRAGRSRCGTRAPSGQPARCCVSCSPPQSPTARSAPTPATASACPHRPAAEMVFLTAEQVETPRGHHRRAVRHTRAPRRLHRPARRRDLRPARRPRRPRRRPDHRRRVRHRGSGPRPLLQRTQDLRAPLGHPARLPRRRAGQAPRSPARRPRRARVHLTRGLDPQPQELLPRHFKPAVTAAGLPAETRFHDLRHTCAALCISLGAHPKAIQERLGHCSSPSPSTATATSSPSSTRP